LVFFFLLLVFLIQLLFILFAYAILEDFKKNIDSKSIDILQKISVNKLKPYANILYIGAVNSLVSGTIMALIYLDNYPTTSTILFLITILLYIFSLSLKYNPDNETFEKNYLSDFIVALVIGLFFNFINELFSFFEKKESFDEWSLIYLIAFIILLVAYLIKEDNNQF